MKEPIWDDVQGGMYCRTMFVFLRFFGDYTVFSCTIYLDLYYIRKVKNVNSFPRLNELFSFILKLLTHFLPTFP